jgi:hypothetical protein
MKDEAGLTEKDRELIELTEKIIELEGKLQTAKIDGIKEAIEKCQINITGRITLKACLVSSLLAHTES